MTWKPITMKEPREARVVLLAREDDLYPVAGCRLGNLWMLEEGGAEDGSHREYPIITGWTPTHWMPAPDTPNRPKPLRRDDAD